MGSHPLNLAFRFALELTSLVAMGIWGWALPGAWRFTGVWLLPVLWMAAWGVFAVPDDPSRGGTPVVVVPGAVRLAIEGCAFALGSYALWRTHGAILGVLLGATTLLHYALSWDRIRWLLQG